MYFSVVKKFAVIFFNVSIPRIPKLPSLKLVVGREGNAGARFAQILRVLDRSKDEYISARARHSWDYNYQRTAHYDGYRISDVSRIHYLRITNKPPIVFPCDIFVVICHLTGECGQMVMFMLLIPLCIVNRNPILQQMLSYRAQFHASKRKYLYSLRIYVLIINKTPS